MIDQAAAPAAGRRFHTLDALRGIAAIHVVCLHLFSRVSPAAYRAVDLFFLLSGFVIAHAYGRDLAAGLSPKRFLALRLVRLYPLFLVGAVLGIGAAVVALMTGGSALSPAAVAIGTAAMILMLPMPPAAGNVALMPLNLPGWSLILELAVNISFAVCARYLTTRRLAVIVALSGVWLVGETVARGTSDAGADWAGLSCALARVVFAFYLGVLLQRVRPTLPRTTNAAWLPLALGSASFMVWRHDPIADLICIAIVFPAIIVAGTRCELPQQRLAAFLGDISYPLYVVHLPIILLVHHFFAALQVDAGRGGNVALLGALILGSRLLARRYDVPVRRRLGARLAAAGHGAR